jgi:signal transduction histidine kinase
VAKYGLLARLSDQSEPGRGSIFTIRLPRIVEASEAVE